MPACIADEERDPRWIRGREETCEREDERVAEGCRGGIIITSCADDDEIPWRRSEWCDGYVDMLYTEGLLCA